MYFRDTPRRPIAGRLRCPYSRPEGLFSCWRIPVPAYTRHIYAQASHAREREPSRRISEAEISSKSPLAISRANSFQVVSRWPRKPCIATAPLITPSIYMQSLSWATTIGVSRRRRYGNAQRDCAIQAALAARRFLNHRVDARGAFAPSSGAAVSRGSRLPRVGDDISGSMAIDGFAVISRARHKKRRCDDATIAFHLYFPAVSL